MDITLADNTRYRWQVHLKLPNQPLVLRTEKRLFTTAFAPIDGELPLIYQETFDDNTLFTDWMVSIQRYLVPSGEGRAIHLNKPGIALPLVYGRLLDTTLQSDFTFQQGVAVMGLRHSMFGSYSALIGSNGEVSLWRGQTMLTSGTAAITAGLSHTVRFSMIGDQLTLTVDETDVLTALDPDPLPYGTTFFTSGGLNPTDILMDNVMLRGVAATEPDPEIEAEAINTVREAYQRQARNRFDAASFGSNGNIAFSRTTSSPIIPFPVVSLLYTIDPVTKVESPLVPNDPLKYIEYNFAFNVDPALSPDGSYIAFSSNISGDYRVWIMSTNGNTITLIAGTLGYSRFPTWRGDGQQLAVQTEPGIYIINLVSNSIEGYIDDGTNPSWSPDSTRIAYNNSRSVGGGTSFEITIETYNVDTHEVRILTNYGAGAPDWSPDSTKIVHNSAGLGTMRVIDSYSGEEIANLDVYGEYPSWSPDGILIAYETIFDNVGIIPMNLATGTISVITTSSDISDPDWTVGQLFITNTPRPTVGTPPTLAPTITPLPPTVTNTPSWQDLATIFPLPMHPPTGTPQARLINGDFVHRGATVATPYHLCSRDANPKNMAGGYHRLISPDDAEVWLIDIEYESPTAEPVPENGHLGYFTVLRIRLQDLPPAILDALKAAPSMQHADIQTLINAAKSNPGSSELMGWIYIGYAHQHSVSIPTPERQAYPTVLPLAEIGISGRTGLTHLSTSVAPEHLDISVYYVSGSVTNVNGVSIEADSEPHAGGVGRFNPHYDDYYNIYKGWRDTNNRYENPYGLIALIDPLILWPLLQEGFTGTISTSTTCQDYP